MGILVILAVAAMALILFVFARKAQRLLLRLGGQR